MKLVVLEKSSVSIEDIDYSALNACADVTYFETLDDVEQVVSAIGDADGVIVNKTQITGEVMDRCPNLKYVGTFATGYNNIDVASAKARGITVCNVPAYSTEGVAQLTTAFILQTATSLDQYVSSVRNGDWKACKNFCYYPFPLTEVAGKTLGIVGYGNIGRRVKEIAKALGMRVLVYSRTMRQGEDFVSLEELLTKSDFVSLHLPLTAQSEKLINAKTLAQMKKTAVLINTSRGGLVDEYALADALKNGNIRASCHDVLSEEPMSENCPLFGIENCYITPHVAWASKESRQRLVGIAAQNVKAFLEGNPQNVVSW